MRTIPKPNGRARIPKLHEPELRYGDTILLDGSYGNDYVMGQRWRTIQGAEVRSFRTVGGHKKAISVYLFKDRSSLRPDGIWAPCLEVDAGWLDMEEPPF